MENLTALSVLTPFVQIRGSPRSRRSPCDALRVFASAQRETIFELVPCGSEGLGSLRRE